LDTTQSVSEEQWSQKYVFNVLLWMHMSPSQKGVCLVSA